jgi:hypothetical protein
VASHFKVLEGLEKVSSSWHMEVKCLQAGRGVLDPVKAFCKKRKKRRKKKTGTELPRWVETGFAQAADAPGRV